MSLDGKKNCNSPRALWKILSTATIFPESPMRAMSWQLPSPRSIHPQTFGDSDVCEIECRSFKQTTSQLDYINTLPFRYLVWEVFSHTDRINFEPQIGSGQSTLIFRCTLSNSRSIFPHLPMKCGACSMYLEKIMLPIRSLKNSPSKSTNYKGHFYRPALHWP